MGSNWKWAGGVQPWMWGSTFRISPREQARNRTKVMMIHALCIGSTLLENSGILATKFQHTLWHSARYIRVSLDTAIMRNGPRCTLPPSTHLRLFAFSSAIARNSLDKQQVCQHREHGNLIGREGVIRILVMTLKPKQKILDVLVFLGCESGASHWMIVACSLLTVS